MKGIADTSFIVAFGNRTDSHHRWAVNLAQEITEPLLTCEAVLAEAAFHLGSSAYVLTLVQDEMLRAAFDCTKNLDQLRELARRYEDRKPDFADLCLVRMSELFPAMLLLQSPKMIFEFTGAINVKLFRLSRPHMHKSAPYKISSVHIGFARKLVPTRALAPDLETCKSLYIN